MAHQDGKLGTQTLVVSVCVAVAVGFLGGVIYSSFHSDSVSSVPLQQQQASSSSMPSTAGGQQQGGLTPQQASAILSLEQRVAVNANDTDAWVQLGNTYFDTHNYRKAIDSYNRYLALQPNNANVLTDLGIMYRNNGQAAEAIAAFDRAMAVDPKHVQAPFNKGIVLLNDLQDYQAAIAVWQKLVESNPGATSGDGMLVSQLIEEVKKQKTDAGGGER